MCIPFSDSLFWFVSERAAGWPDEGFRNQRQGRAVFYRNTIAPISSRNTFFSHSAHRVGWVSGYRQSIPHQGSQKTRTQGDLADAFPHDRGHRSFGVGRLNTSKCFAQSSIGIVPNASQLFGLRSGIIETGLGQQTPPVRLSCGHSLKSFLLSKQELESLFQTSVPDIVHPFLTPQQFDDSAITRRLQPALMPPRRRAGTLSVLSLHEVGPAHELEFSPAERLSIITGDNGLGKTFLLECAWWKPH